MEYSMNNIGEAKRLEKQALQKNYSLETEFKNFIFEENNYVLEVGCGSGVVSRHMADISPKSIKIEAIDSSSIRLEEAKKFNTDEKYKNIRFSLGNAYDLPFPSNSFDKVVCRFVLEHLESPQAAIKEMLRVLKPNGHLYIIDLDGILFGVYGCSDELTRYHEILGKKFQFDLWIGHKLRSMIENSGGNIVFEKIEPMLFQGHELELEVQNYQERFLLARDVFIKCLESDKEFENYARLYLKEIQNKDTRLEYKKYLISATKA